MKSFIVSTPTIIMTDDKVKDSAIKLKQIPKVDEDKVTAAIAGFEDIINIQNNSAV